MKDFFNEIRKEKEKKDFITFKFIFNTKIKYLSGKTLENELSQIVQKSLPNLILLSEKEPDVEKFVRQPELYTFWDRERYNFHTLKHFPQTCNQKTPQPGFYSWDLIVGDYCAFKGAYYKEEDNTHEANWHFDMAEKHYSIFGQQYAISCLLDKLKNSPNKRHEIMEQIMGKINLIKLHGTPGYYISAYAIAKLTEAFRDEESLELFRLCCFWISIYITVAEKLTELSQISIKNSEEQEGFQEGTGIDTLIEDTKKIAESISWTKEDRENMCNEVKKEISSFKTWLNHFESEKQTSEEISPPAYRV